MTHEEKARELCCSFGGHLGEFPLCANCKRILEALSSAEKKGSELQEEERLLILATAYDQYAFDKEMELEKARKEIWNEAIESCVERYKVLRERNASQVEVAESINKLKRG